jgi:hypothetical protein
MSRAFAVVVVAIAGLASVQTVSALGLMQVARSIIGAEERTNICRPDLKRDGQVPELADAFVALKAAMTKNAELLHPDGSPAQLAADVDQYVENGRKHELTGPANPQLCNEQMLGWMRTSIGKLSDPKFAADLMTMGEMLGPYDTRLPLSGKPGAPMTYAIAGSQRNLLRMINDSQSGGCAAPEVDQVVLVFRAPGGALHLPPFILPPIQYTEEWQVHCGAAVHQMVLTFKEDSEGPAGVAEVHAK